MTIERARIIKATSSAPFDEAVTVRDPPGHARRIAADILAAREEAALILHDARSRAAFEAREAAEKAALEARERETARLAAGFLALRHEREMAAERDTDRLVELAVILAERLVGEALRVEPTRIAMLATAAIREARGATTLRIEACPDDVTALHEVLGGIAVAIEADPSLSRGSLVVHTDLGDVDARLETQLERLASALREALR